jgi:hypothetical protein
MMMRVMPIAILLIARIASAAEPPCSILPAAGTPESEWPKLTKISPAEAGKAALASLKSAPQANVTETTLAVERGCLVYEVDIRMAGKSGLIEVYVDPGNAKVLSRKHKSPSHVAADQVAKEATKAAKEKPSPAPTPQSGDVAPHAPPNAGG